MRILIIKTSALGDIIHALPVLDYLKATLQDAEIGWVVEEHCKEILEGHPYLSHLHQLRSRKWRSSLFAVTTWCEIAATVSEIRAVGYDCILDIQGNAKSGVVGLMSGVKRRLGFPTERMQEWVNNLFVTERTKYDPADNHATLRCLSVAQAICHEAYDIGQHLSRIAVNPTDEQRITSDLSGLKPGRKVLFHTGTTWQTKFWSPESWMQLGRVICRQYPDVSILLSWGNQQEQGMVSLIASGIGECARVAERYQLKPFVALLRQMDLVVGGDTGPVHLAAVLGTPTVSLYRSSDGSESGPRGAKHIIVQSPLPCTRCFKTSCSRDAECRASITVAMMFDAVRQILTPED